LPDPAPAPGAADVNVPTTREAEAARRAAVARMLEARSVAVVGASVRRGSLGHQMMVELVRGGFDGSIYPVNPGYESVEGFRCYPSVGEVPEAVDLAILGVANHRVEGALREAAEAGARSALTFASLHEEPGEGTPPLTDRLAAIANDHGMAFCGGNGMGFINVRERLRATGFATPDRIGAGPVAFISHSGSAFAALAFNDRGIGFTLLVSSGQEIVSSAADYLDYCLRLESTGLVALFLETVREPARFRDALELARERGVPVIALKVGRSEGAREMIAAHSGALAGEDGAYEALFEAHGVHRVSTLDELVDAAELFSCPRRVVSGSGIASLHDSGGERVLFADLAADAGVPFARIGPRTEARIQEALDPGLVAGNPLDAWGTGIDHERIFIECLEALHADPETAVVAFVVDLTRQGEPYDEGYLHVAREAFARTDKPFCVVSNLPSAIAHEEAAVLRASGIPVLEGAASALRALGLLLAERDVRTRHAAEPPPFPPDDARGRWRARLASGRALDEVDALELVGAYGVPTVESARASSERQAVEVAEAIGWPVALKTAATGIAHKSDVGGVMLDIADADELAAAYADLASRLGPGVTVAAMAPAGVELALGVVHDAQFGPLVLVAAGGLLVEVLHDRRLALPPLDPRRARKLVDGLRTRPLLEGVRGARAADVGAVVDALVALSALALDLGEHVAAIDVNPLIATPDGCVAVDALAVVRPR
jgi:acyl-CoA synthetase (NDP forming)